MSEATKISGYEDQSSREIEHDIERTRDRMDRTLEEIGERLHPKHLLDEVLDFFRSSDGRSKEYGEKARDIGRDVLRKVKQHPIPALLCGAGLAWLMVEEKTGDEFRPRRRRRRGWEDLPEYESYADWETEEDEDAIYVGPYCAAWDEEYDWSAAEQDEATWSESARTAADEIRATLGRQDMSAKDKLRAAAGKLVNVSGRKQEEIHSQWADLREHGESFVDARTGEPYDDSYGQEWGGVVAAHYVASEDWPEEEESKWSEKAKATLDHLNHALSDTGASAKHQLRKAADSIRQFVGQTRRTSGRYGRRAGEGARRMVRGGRRRAERMMRGGRRGAERMMHGGRRGAERVQQSFEEGYGYTRDRFVEAIEENPLAVGAAFLGLGLIAGLAVPATRSEDRWMGEASDDVKRQSRQKGEEVLRRGQRAGKAALDAAAEEMEEQGLTPERVGQSVRRAVTRTREAVEEEMPETDQVKEKVAAVAQRSAEAAREEATGEDRPKQRPR